MEPGNNNEASKRRGLEYAPSGRGGWILIKIFEPSSLPKCCCCCLSEFVEWRRLESIFAAPVDFPMCRRCRRQWRFRYLITVVITLCPFLVPWLAFSHLLSSGLVRELALYGLFAALLVGHIIALPVQMGWWLRGNRTVWVRFRNAAYRSLIVEDLRRDATVLRTPPRPARQGKQQGQNRPRSP